MKKFKPPSFINGVGPPTSTRDDGGDDNVLPVTKKARVIQVSTTPPAKKQTISSEISTSTSKIATPRSVFRKPLHVIKAPVVNAATLTVTDGPESFFRVVWRKPTNKKHKTWDGDGILSVVDGRATLQDMSGKEISRGRYTGGTVGSGDLLSVGGKECEIETALDREEYMSGRVFLKNAKASPLVDYAHIKAQSRIPFKNPLRGQTQAVTASLQQPAKARHDPQALNAIVLSRPKHLKGNDSIVDVVVDPFIGQFLRPHQREGVAFLYDCIMRFKNYDGAGAILADEMGLGKTIQTIALIWTLLKQHFLPGQGPLAKKILIVCPVTLTNNWKREFRKWLGQDRIGVFVVDSKANLRDFLCGRVYQVMIIGYEKLRLIQETDELKTANFDVIVCDEGHKLKSANNKAAHAIRSLNTTRRIILSGTPIQNDLGEFFVMIDFVNPGLLGTYSTFKKEFENPILKARMPDATKKDKEKGAARSTELARITDLFILRRTTELLTGYLPPKNEYVVFCKPTQLQIDCHEKLLSTPAATQCLGGQNAAFQLQGITHLRKICNSPGLLCSTPGSTDVNSRKSANDDETFQRSIQSLIKGRSAAKQSGKLLVLERLLLLLRQTGEEKIVIVSQFTQTLQVLQDLLELHSMSYCRLDGSTPATKRQEMVDRFNRSSAANCFGFLLSAKSGGCGLNLIGASRLVLYDSDWNPSVDLQAMARIHRDGQKLPVFIYRFLTTGMIDEKIYQRQVTKQGLSDSLMDSKVSGTSFSLEELRDLFRCHADTDCLTHDMLLCSCQQDGLSNDVDALPQDDFSDDEEDTAEATWVRASQVEQNGVERRPKQSSMRALRIYDHISSEIAANDFTAFEFALGDKILSQVIQSQKDAQGQISYTFVKKSGIAPPTLEESIDETIDFMDTME